MLVSFYKLCFINKAVGKHSENGIMKIKKIIKKQLYFVSIGLITAILISIIYYEIDQHQYSEVSSDKFLEIAIKNKTTNFYRYGKRWEIIIPSGEKYYHNFLTYTEAHEFEDIISDKSGSSGYYIEMHSFYYTLTNVVLFLLIVIFVLNLILIWCYSLFDLLKSEFIYNHNKWIWFISLIILPIISPFFYIAIAEEQKK